MTPPCVPLSRLFASSRPPDLPVATGRAGVQTVADLATHTAALAERIDKTGRGLWLLHCHDSYAFGVALLALAQSESSALVPPNAEPETLRVLAGETLGSISDADAPANLPGDFPVVHPLKQPPATRRRLGVSEREAVCVHLFTSGTTGDGKRVTKRLRHLEDEVAELERLFGEKLGPAAQVLASVSHHHIYGLLFRLLWPLAVGRPFARETLLQPAELAPFLTAEADYVLVGTPTYLKRVPALAGVRAARGAHGAYREYGTCRAVFSSGGPLASEDASAVADALAASVNEIYGSTETGGIAWREAAHAGGKTTYADVRRESAAPQFLKQAHAGGKATLHPPRWISFPSVILERNPANSRLIVRSPFVSTGESLSDGSARTVTGDRVDWHDDGSFTLRERADRVVKIGEKRLALPALEAQLAAHPYVAEVQICPVERGSETRTGCALVLTPEGAAALVAQGRRELTRVLLAHLQPHWDRVLLPRLWRFLPALPRDAQGKFSLQVLQAFFERSSDAAHRETSSERAAGITSAAKPARNVAPARELARNTAAFHEPTNNRRPRSPLLESEQQTSDTLERELRVPENLAYFEGHFDALPVVAGVVQLGWVMEAAVLLCGGPPTLRGIEALKFRETLGPGQRFRMRLSLERERGVLHFELRAGERVFASGRCLLEGVTEVAGVAE